MPSTALPFSKKRSSLPPVMTSGMTFFTEDGIVRCEGGPVSEMSEAKLRPWHSRGSVMP